MHIQHDPAGHRFYLELPAGTAQLSYEEGGEGTLNFFHTYVPDAARGQGIAARLVEAAVAWAREERRRVIPSCWYVAKWFREHPDAADVMAG